LVRFGYRSQQFNIVVGVVSFSKVGMVGATFAHCQSSKFGLQHSD